MKTITLEKFITFHPCYSREQLEEIRGDKTEWSALDILALDDVPADDRLWAVLRPELIDEMTLHEFGCRCGKRALDRIDNPDPRSVRAIEIKRAWMRGEATDEELEEVSAAASAAARGAAWAARYAAWAARYAAWDAAWDAARGASRYAAWDAARGASRYAVWDAARYAAWDAARAAERQWQIDELKRMLEGITYEYF